VPKTGHGFANAKPKSNPQRRAALSRQTAAPKTFGARNALHSTSRPTAVMFGACLCVAITFNDLDRLQLQYPRAVSELVAGERAIQLQARGTLRFSTATVTSLRQEAS